MLAAIRQSPDEAWPCVYLLHSENQRYKIGWSRQPAARIKDIAFSPVAVTCVHVIRCSHAQRLERYLHQVLRPFHAVREWFDLPDDVVAALRSAEVIRLTPHDPDWLAFVRRLEACAERSLGSETQELMRIVRTDYISLPAAAKAIGISDRALQKWMKPYVAQRTLDGYPLDLVVRVAREHQATVSEADLRVQRVEHTSPRQYWRPGAQEEGADAVEEASESLALANFEAMMAAVREAGERAAQASDTANGLRERAESAERMLAAISKQQDAALALLRARDEDRRATAERLDALAAELAALRARRPWWARWARLLGRT